MRGIVTGLAAAALLTFGLTAAQQPPATSTVAAAAMHAKAARRLVITNAMVIYGNAKPAYGPVDIVVQDGLISYIGSAPAARTASDSVIDGTGKYVMPGIVNAHMHWHEERQPGVPQPIQYERNLYLAAGVTTAREVGGDFDKSKRWQAESNAHTIIAPRILVYPFVSKGRSGAPAEIRVDGENHVFRGRVTEIATRAEFTPRAALTEDERANLVFGVKVALDPTHGTLKPGLPAEARILEPGR